MTKSVTGHDVARLAGVSQATVSRALRNLPGTSPAVRAAVLDAAARLSYVPSDHGRTLSTRRTRRIAVVAEELTNPYYPALVEPLRRELRDRQLRTVLVGDTPAGQSEKSNEILDQLVDGSYDGVILTTTTRRSRLPRDLSERGIPHVLAHRVLDSPESLSCTFDNREGARLVAALVASLGHELVGSIQGPIETSTGRERAAALRVALRDKGIALSRALSLRMPFQHDAGQAAATSLLQQSPRPSVIVCGNDVLAMGALSAASTMGVGVPTDLTVIGFDDIAMAAWPFIGLTTVHCDLPLLAKTAVDMLVQTMSAVGERASPEWEGPVRLPVSLELRRTHGPAPGLAACGLSSDTPPS